MRLLFLSDHFGYANGVTHGATTYFTSVLPRLRSDDIDLTVCFLRERHPAVDRLEKFGIHPIFLNRGKWDVRALTDLVNIIRQRDVQIVHAAGMKGILFGRLAARMTGARAIVHLHDTKQPGMLLGRLQRMTARWSDLALVVSRAVGELAEESFGIPPSQVVTMHNPVDIDQFAHTDRDSARRMREDLHIPMEAPVIAMTGRLGEEKGHSTLLNQMPGILAKRGDAMLVIAGDGPQRDACRRRIEELGIGASVRMLGNRSDIPDILAAVDVVALPSSREGLSYSGLEAMAAGRPVVAFAVGGLVELLCNEKTGLLVPAGDGESFAASLLRVLNDRELAERLAESARVRVRSLSVGAHVSELKSHYRSVLNQPRGLAAEPGGVGQ